MPFIRMPTDPKETAEEAPVDPAIYDLEIIHIGEVKVKEETGNTVIPVSIRICDPNFPSAELVSHWVVLPAEDCKPSTYDMLMRGYRRFCAVFGLDDSQEFDTDDWLHASGKCFLTLDEWDGRPINKLQPPRLSA